MSLKKELLDKLTEDQLKSFAESKGISFSMNKRQEKYYESWNERDKMIDIITDKGEISIGEIEEYIKLHNYQDT
jgi:hypothetical protein